MAQYNFSSDWDRFFEELGANLSNRQTFEKEYDSICRKARGMEYDNQIDSACYYYMATVLCYLFYDDPGNPNDDRKWAVDMGKSSIKKALDLLPDDEEFLSLLLVFDLLDLQYFDESSINLKSLFQKVQFIKRRCPHIESIENTLINNDFLRKWFNDALGAVLGPMLYCKNMDEDKQLKIECASELISSSNTLYKMAAYESLADAYFDLGNYEESQRYALLGKDLLGSLSEYNHDDMLQRLWGICWHIYAKCQEEFGDKDFAMALFEKEMSLGIPWYEKELNTKNE